jgi:hypothetical protein
MPPPVLEFAGLPLALRRTTGGTTLPTWRTGWHHLMRICGNWCRLSVNWSLGQWQHWDRQIRNLRRARKINVLHFDSYGNFCERRSMSLKSINSETVSKQQSAGFRLFKLLHISAYLQTRFTITSVLAA